MLFARLAFRIARVLPLSLSVVEYSFAPIFLRLSFSLRDTSLPILLPQPLFSLSLFCQRIIGERRRFVVQRSDPRRSRFTSVLFRVERARDVILERDFKYRKRRGSLWWSANDRGKPNCFHYRSDFCRFKTVVCCRLLSLQFAIYEFFGKLNLFVVMYPHCYVMFFIA